VEDGRVSLGGDAAEAAGGGCRRRRRPGAAPERGEIRRGRPTYIDPFHITLLPDGHGGPLRLDIVFDLAAGCLFSPSPRSPGSSASDPNPGSSTGSDSTATGFRGGFEKEMPSRRVPMPDTRTRARNGKHADGKRAEGLSSPDGKGAAKAS